MKTYDGFCVLLTQAITVTTGIIFIALGASIESLLTSLLPIGVLLVFPNFFLLGGYYSVANNECKVFELCSKYCGTSYEVGYRWVPFYYSGTTVSLRVSNFETSKIVCNDASGTPIVIEVVVVAQVRDPAASRYNV